VRVNFALPEHDRSRLKIGQTVDFTTDSFPGRVFTARLSTIDPQIGTDTRTIHLQASADNPDHALLPGMFAEVNVMIDADAEVVAVPETAVDVTLAGEGVYLVTADQGSAGQPVMHAQRVPVKTADRFDGLVAVTEGLSAGATVVSAGQSRLIPGFPVVPHPDQARLALAHQ
jgi:multidrug efflux system membrane fusion protein